MIELLDHQSEAVVRQIYDVFQLSYEIEAGLVGSPDFPPLRRRASHIQSSKSQFLGELIGTDLVSVVEFSKDGDELSIDSLVVHPQYFRRGLASQLLRALLKRELWQSANVETAAANSPALDLYRKFGFSESKRWLTADGIEKVRLDCGSSVSLV
jgi:ribosomal protein S18 acetylase RimI-like enzyme